MHLKMSSGKWRTPCLGLNVLAVREVTAIPVVADYYIIMPAVGNQGTLVRSTNSQFCNPVGKFEESWHTPVFISPLYTERESTVCHRISASSFFYFDWEIRDKNAWKYIMGFRTFNWNECHVSILILWSFREPLNVEVSNKEGCLLSELYLMFLHRTVSLKHGS